MLKRLTNTVAMLLLALTPPAAPPPIPQFQSIDRAKVDRAFSGKQKEIILQIADDLDYLKAQSDLLSSAHDTITLTSGQPKQLPRPIEFVAIEPPTSPAGGADIGVHQGYVLVPPVRNTSFVARCGLPNEYNQITLSLDGNMLTYSAQTPCPQTATAFVVYK